MSGESHFISMKSLPSCILIIALLATAEVQAQKIRIATANPYSSDTGKYGPHGTRIIQGIAADIVLLQQFNVGNNTTDVPAYVTSTFGAGFSYTRGPFVTNSDIPTGIVSRYPILNQGAWADPFLANRGFTWACIDIPGETNLWVVSIHFATSAGSRPQEATALVNLIQANIPAADYLIVGGIFNSSSRSEAQFTTLSAVVNTAGPHPADQSGNENTNRPRTQPYSSVFANAAFKAQQTPVTIGSASFPNGLVVDTRVFSPLTALAPALVGDSDAINNIPVIKEFTIPLPPQITDVSFSLNTPALGNITFTSSPSTIYQLQASSTLQPGSWSTLGNISATSASTSIQIVRTSPASGQFTDPQLGTAAKRFYRIARP